MCVARILVHQIESQISNCQTELVRIFNARRHFSDEQMTSNFENSISLSNEI
jgi:hypothetical protein